MDLDDEICYCYHVSLRKLRNFATRRELQRASQMSECLGAGTGCGWCIPILKSIYESARADAGQGDFAPGMTPAEYAQARDAYRKSGQPKNEF